MIVMCNKWSWCVFVWWFKCNTSKNGKWHLRQLKTVDIRKRKWVSRIETERGFYAFMMISPSRKMQISFVAQGHNFFSQWWENISFCVSRENHSRSFDNSINARACTVFFFLDKYCFAPDELYRLLHFSRVRFDVEPFSLLIVLFSWAAMLIEGSGKKKTITWETIRKNDFRR